MTIIEDVAQKENKHKLKNNYWKSNGIEVIRQPLPVGDYILINDKVQDVIERKEKRGISVKKMDFLGTYNVCVDSKFSIQELIGDICGKSHERFRHEPIRAFFNIEKSSPEYLHVNTIMQSEDKTEMLVQNAKRDLENWKKRYESIKEFLEPAWSVINETFSKNNAESA